MSDPRLGIVILNYRGQADTLACLDSLLGATYRGTMLVVVDNDSRDGSMEAFRAWAQDRKVPVALDVDLRRDPPPTAPFRAGHVALVQVGENRGFSHGNNAGIACALASGADLVMVLANDTLVPPETLARLVETIQEDPRYAMVFPRVEGFDGELQIPVWLRPPRNLWEHVVVMNVPGWFVPRLRPRAYFERRNPFPDYRYDAPLAVPNVVSAMTVFRRAFLEEIGGFDPEMFIYYEEDAILAKMRGTTHLSVLEPRVKILHKGGASRETVTGAFLYRKRAQTEDLYLRRYARVRWPGRALVKALRCAMYAREMFRRADYRREAKAFWSEYVWG